MAFITTIPVDEAQGAVRAMYASSQHQLGHVANFVKVFSGRPAVMAAWQELIASIRGAMDQRRYELVTLAAARALHSSYCMLAHAAVLRRELFSSSELQAIASDFRSAGLTPAEVAVMAFAERVVRDASAISAADVDALRAHGLSDREIFDVAAAASARCFFSKLVDALGAEPDAPFAAVADAERRALVVGRAISADPPETLPGS